MSLRLPVTGKDYVEGNPEATIELVEYGDYQCPYCGQAYIEVKKIQKEMGDHPFLFVFSSLQCMPVHNMGIDNPRIQLIRL